MPIYEYKCAECGKVSTFLEGVRQCETENKEGIKKNKWKLKNKIISI